MTATNDTTTPATGSGHAPPTPLQGTFTTILSQDVVTTATVPVDATSASPLGAFTNPASGDLTGSAEALAVIQGQVSHVARSPNSDGGWKVVQPFGNRPATAVAAGTAYSGSANASVYGHFTDGNRVYAAALQSDGTTWSAPEAVQQLSGGDLPATVNLRAAYSPAGRLVVYGNTSAGDLVVAYQETIGGNFQGSVVAMNGVLSQGDFHLSMVDESNWTLAANNGGQAWLYTGQLGATESSSSEQASGFHGTLKQVALSYWSSVQNTLIFLFVDADHALHVWATNAASSTTVARPVPNSNVTHATGHVSAADSTLHVYSLDSDQKLWVSTRIPGIPGMTMARRTGRRTSHSIRASPGSRATSIPPRPLACSRSTPRTIPSALTSRTRLPECGGVATCCRRRARRMRWFASARRSASSTPTAHRCPAIP